MVEESVEVEREPAKLFAKILPVMNHHKCTSYGISKESYGSSSYKLGGKGQGSSVSGAICRDTSYLIFKKLENQNLGLIVKTSISHQDVVRSSITFVDDTDFYTNSRNFMEKIQEAMNTYTGLYEATGGKLQQTKIMFYYWRWVHENGVKEIEELSATLVVYEEQTQKIETYKSTRTLEVQVTPILD